MEKKTVRRLIDRLVERDLSIADFGFSSNRSDLDLEQFLEEVKDSLPTTYAERVGEYRYWYRNVETTVEHDRPDFEFRGALFVTYNYDYKWEERRTSDGYTYYDPDREIQSVQFPLVIVTQLSEAFSVILELLADTRTIRGKRKFPVFVPEATKVVFRHHGFEFNNTEEGYHGTIDIWLRPVRLGE